MMITPNPMRRLRSFFGKDSMKDYLEGIWIDFEARIPGCDCGACPSHTGIVREIVRETVGQDWRYVAILDTGARCSVSLLKQVYRD